MKKSFIYAATLCMAGALTLASCDDEKDPIDEDKTPTEKPEPSGISGAKHDICGDTVRLTATAVTGATSYVWYNGDDSIAETTETTYDATAVGSYSVAAKNEGGKSAKSDAWSIVSGCVGAAGAISQVDQLSSVLLSVNNIEKATTYNWYRADTENGTYEQVASVDTADGNIDNARRYNATTVGWYTVAGANSYGEGARATPVQVTEIPTPEPPAAPTWNANVTTTTAYVDSTITLSVAGMLMEMPYIKYIWYELGGGFLPSYTEIPSDSANVLTLTKSEAGTYRFAVKRLNTQTGLISEYSEDRTVMVTEPPTDEPGDDAPVTLDDFSTDGVTFRVYEKAKSGSGFFAQISPVDYTVTVKKFGFGLGDKVQIVGLGQTLTNVTTSDGVIVSFTLDEAAQELVADTTYEEPFYPRAIDAEYTGNDFDPNAPVVYIATHKAGTADGNSNVLKAEVKRVNGKITIFIPSVQTNSGDKISYRYLGRVLSGGQTYYDLITNRYGIDDATAYGWAGQTGTVIVEEE
jgi:hypothetical protein